MCTDSFGIKQITVPGSCEHGNEHLVFPKGIYFLVYVKDYCFYINP